MAPMISVFLLSSLLVIFHFFGIPFSTCSIYCIFLIILSTLSIIMHKDLKHFFYQQLIPFFRSSSIHNIDKLLVIIVILGILGFNLLSLERGIWPGDGMGHWARKASEWAFYHHLTYSSDVTNDLALWMSYPVYHVLGMTLNLLLLQPFYPKELSVHYFDAFYTIGLILTAMALLARTNHSRREILFGGIIITFAHRTLFAMINSGYAEIDVTYFLFLGTVLLVTGNSHGNENEKVKKFENYSGWPSIIPSIKDDRELLMIGLTFSLLSITKEEGIIRTIITLAFYQLFNFLQREKPRSEFYPEKSEGTVTLTAEELAPADLRPSTDQKQEAGTVYFRNWRQLLVICLFVISIFIVNKLLLPRVEGYTKNQYLNAIVTDWDTLRSRFYLVTKALYLYYKIETLSWIKCYWPVAFSLSAFYVGREIFFYQRKRSLIIFFYFLFWCQTFFNILPNWLAPLKEDTSLDYPLPLAHNIMVRLNAQITPLLSASIVLGMIYFYYEIYNKKNN